MTLPIDVLVLLLTLAIFSAISFKKKLLNFEGVLIANIVGIAIFLLSGNSLLFFFVAVLFFLVAEAATFYSNKRKPKHEIRTTGNIFGNSFIAVIALGFGFQFGFFAAFASALADTLSSEIGILSRKKPVLITTLKQVSPGTDGGITQLGLAASVFGAAIMGTLHFALFGNVFLLGVLILSGFFGSLVDSFCGAVFERPGMLNNAEVNFLGTLGGTALAWLLISL